MSQTKKYPYTIISNKFETYLKINKQKSLLKLIVCGSVDDGKSTLIGRLLHDSKKIYNDHYEQLKFDSKKNGTQGKDIDLALLVDGLSAEREQGITIDVAYRYLDTEKRKFILLDTPGHEQFTRNMITGASNAELAIILIDAQKGILTQTRRHTYLCHLMGIKNFILAVNKIDLVKYNQEKFNKIKEEYKIFAKRIGISILKVIPISSLKGDNVFNLSKNTPWFNELSLMDFLKAIQVDDKDKRLQTFCMPVQWVNRPNLDFRGYSGKIETGKVKVGDQVAIQPLGKTTQIKSIVTYDGNIDIAFAGQSITLTLKDDVDCSRGQIISSALKPLDVADQFETTIIWMDDDELIPGRSYYLKIGTQIVSAIVTKPKFKINVNTLERLATETFFINDIGIANITTDRLIPFSTFSDNKALGSFILINKITNATSCAGFINFSLSQNHNIRWENITVNRKYHAKLKNQLPTVIWMTGLSGSGKSAIANVLQEKLIKMKHHTFILDGDNIRHRLNKDLGFTNADRIENIRRIGEVAKLMTDAGLIVIVAFISPFRLERKMVREMMEPNEFFEVFIDTPIEIAEARDPKGLYAKARSGLLKNFTGIDSKYEIPKYPDIHIKNVDISIDEAAEQIIDKISKRLNI
jgi:bifunctional enzyme CysN/CysC